MKEKPESKISGFSFLAAGSAVLLESKFPYFCGEPKTRNADRDK